MKQLIGRLTKSYRRKWPEVQTQINQIYGKLSQKFPRPLQYLGVTFLIFYLIYDLFFTLSDGIPGYIEGKYVRISLPFSGQLQELMVQEGDPIEPGKILYKLDDREERALFTQAQEKLNETKAQLSNLLKGKRKEEIDVLKAHLEAAKSQLELAEVIYKRQKSLAVTKVTSRENLDKAETEYERAKARVAELESEIEVARLTARPDEIQAADARVTAAQAAVDQAAWRLEQKVALAPQAGVITQKFFEQGEFVPAQMPVVELLPKRAVKAIFFVKEAVMAALKHGQKVEIVTSHHKIPAKISFISPSAEYTPPVIYSNETNHKLIFRIEAQPLQTSEELHPGQPIVIYFP
jgi:HlyD family secretion protein